MASLPIIIKDAVNSFSKLPGVGEKTALRQVMAMTKWSKEEVNFFAASLSKLNNLGYCSKCGMFSEEDICNICTNESRKLNRSICVVESISDLMAIENSNVFHGVYHILGGVLNPLSGVGPKQLNMDKLKERVSELDVESIILAINPSVEGDATCTYIHELFPKVNIERIGFGIPMGGSLELLDSATISKALENRKSL